MFANTEKSFRPLMGINFNQTIIDASLNTTSFRPLSGINFNLDGQSRVQPQPAPFPSPLGDKFQHERVPAGVQACGFRPLTGINFNELLDEMISYLKKVSVPSRG